MTPLTACKGRTVQGLAAPIFSRLARTSGCLVVLGPVAAGVALSSAPSFVADVVLLGLPPLVGGAVTGLLALRR